MGHPDPCAAFEIRSDLYIRPVGQGLALAFLHQGHHSYLKVMGVVVRVSPEGIGIKFNPLNQREKTGLMSLSSSAEV